MYFALIVIVISLIWYFRSATARANDESEMFAAIKCRRCGYDMRATPDRCPECGSLSIKARSERLQNDWPTEPIEPRVPDALEKWVSIYTAETGMEATLLQQQLEARGVACRIDSNAKTYLLSGSYTPTHTVQELVVPEGDIERARMIVHRLLETSDAV